MGMGGGGEGGDRETRVNAWGGVVGGSKETTLRNGNTK